MKSKKNGELSIVSCYGFVSETNRNLESTLILVKHAMARGRPLIILGDHNMPVDFCKTCLSYYTGLVDVVDIGGTCFSQTSASTIDFTIMSRSLFSQHVSIANNQSELATHLVISMKLGFAVGTKVAPTLKTNCWPDVVKRVGPNFAVAEAQALSASVQSLLTRYKVKPGISKFWRHKAASTVSYALTEQWEAWDM